ncbi:hypothetical protein V7024_22200 [Bacillus sp. JJ864]|uniref:hypothetical protein n=1 Tax=Bacillus sp. JJ864 TaxID=3122975 RepID=UPI002FFFABD0
MRILETVYESSVLLLVICSFFYYLHLRKMKRERKLSSFEFTMYIITQFAYILWAGSSLLKILSK